MLRLREDYKSRPIRFLELLELGGWRLKVYGIAYQDETPCSGLVESAKELARRQLPALSAGKNHYEVGFLGIHDGRGANFVFLDFWTDENELHHHVYVSPLDEPAQLEYVTPTGLSACVWDLAVICHERQAWVQTVLANPAGPDVEAYLKKRLNKDL